jgi:hypothetical protein
MVLEVFFTDLASKLIGNIIDIIPNPFKDKTQKEKAVKVILNIYSVVQLTRFHISQNNGKHVASPELTEKYTELLNEIAKLKHNDMPIEIPEYLYQKAKYWINPEAIILNQDVLEQIPRLKEIEEQCLKVLCSL